MEKLFGLFLIGLSLSSRVIHMMIDFLYIARDYLRLNLILRYNEQYKIGWGIFPRFYVNNLQLECFLHVASNSYYTAVCYLFPFSC